MKKILGRILIISQLTLVLFAYSMVFVAPQPVSAGHCVAEKNSNILGIPRWYKYLNIEHDATGRCSPDINTSADALPIGIAVLEALLRVGGLVAVAMVIIGSYKYIISVGNPEKATSARKTIINSLIGLVIIIVSTGVTTFIGGALSR